MVMSYNQDLAKTNDLYNNYIDYWKFLIDSYVGSKDYRDGGYLQGYQMESQGEYDDRLVNTPLDNHVKAIVAIYNAFLYRKPPKRDFGSISNDPGLNDFLQDADLDGRTFDSIMRDVSTFSSVYGHTWVVVDKPQSTAYTRAEELSQGIRPYISIYTPENVFDWQYRRQPNGVYVLTFLKVYEGRQDGRDTYRIYTPETIQVISVDVENSNDTVMEFEIPNLLGTVPAVCVYSQRSPHRGVGISDVGDVADMQRAIYGELSEAEQLLRLTNHPSLVKTNSTQAAAGAGAIITMPEDLNGELKPFLLQPSGASIDGLLNSLKHKIESIDRMAYMGGIRSIESRRLSGVALATEFQLLNAKLAERADNLEFAEENIWRLYARWQGSVWDGSINYPDSFNIQDKYNDMNMLKLAKDSGPRSEVVNEEIERQMLRILVDDDERFEQLVQEIDIELVNGEAQSAVTPAVETQEEEQLEHPVTTDENREEHLQAMLMEGYTNEQMLALHPEITEDDIIAAGAAAARNN
jgi:hypothetical protein